jgi:hypothetical protein
LSAAFHENKNYHACIATQKDTCAMQATSIALDLDTALNESQAAQFLGVSVRTLQAWRVRGGGPRYCKIGRAVRDQRRELVSFQEAHTVGSTTEAGAKGGGR